MELSGLIFVALAVAWAAYLIPKALQHHEEVVRSRSVDRFSHRMRVLARREPVNGRNARLVVTPGPRRGPAGGDHQGLPLPRRPAPVARRSRRPTRRRRRVLGALVLITAAVGRRRRLLRSSAWWYVAIPVGALAAWLVACRLMVRGERGLSRTRVAADARDRARPPRPSRRPGTRGSRTPRPAPAVVDVPIDPEAWDPLPVTLPTYVSKPAAARRTVRTIDLDSTGVWSSGRSESDTALAREADEADRAARADRARRRDDGSRAFGS